MRVPFPHVERAVMVVRPALVLTVRETQVAESLLWVLMVTNAKRPHWHGDVPIDDWERLGLLIPSKVRTAKISTVAAGQAGVIGRLDDRTWKSVVAMVAPFFPQ